jgi:hypothetical protein
MRMDEKVKKSAVRFIESTGRWADADIFAEDDAWEFMRELCGDARKFMRLNDGQLMSLRNLGAALGMRPGLPISGYIPALTRAFGESPLTDEEMRTLVRYTFGQVNGGGDFEPAQRPRVSLSPALPGERWGTQKKQR